MSGDMDELVQNKRKRFKNSSGKGKPFCCTECGLHFRYNCELAAHHRVHTGEKPFSCGVCDQGFNRKTHLLRHERIHTGEKPFTCSDCGKCFIQRSDLVRHGRIHTGGKLFSCGECDKRFHQKSNLVRHIKVHLRKRSFCCTNCNESFTSKTDLLDHEKVHSDMKMTCNECEKYFSTVYIGEKSSVCPKGDGNLTLQCGCDCQFKESQTCAFECKHCRETSKGFECRNLQCVMRSRRKDNINQDFHHLETNLENSLEEMSIKEEIDVVEEPLEKSYSSKIKFEDDFDDM